MHRKSPASTDSGRNHAHRWLTLRLGAGIFVLGGFSWWALSAPDSLGPAHSIQAGWLILLLIFGATTALAGWLAARHGLTQRLEEARQTQLAIQELVGTWLWRTDSQHHLTLWRPPQHASAANWLDGPQLNEPLFQVFEVLEPTACPGVLQARLDARGPIHALRVARCGKTGSAAWRLQAVPLFDPHGTFLGHIGTADSLATAEQRQYDQALLQALWQDLPMAAVALQEDGPQWRIQACSHEAAQLLQWQPSPPTQGADWLGTLSAGSGALASALTRMAVGTPARVGDWQVAWRTFSVAGNDAPPGQLLLLHPANVEVAPPLAVEAHPDSAADHESFIYSVSHDLRAPLRVVDGFARILKEDYGRFLDRIGNDHLDRVLAASARMNSMIDALLALSRLQSQPLSLKPVDLSQLAGFILEDLQREAPDRNATLRVEPGLVVLGDPTLLRIAMENLLGNAWKYSSQSPQTQIEFRSETQADGRRILVVADQGAGFDMRFADRLFGVFQRLHSPKDFQGTGVGLASVRRILRRHGGDIWAESEVGKGARFYFTVGPLQPTPAAGRPSA
jgi:signal transduction histidine kinase